MTEELLDKYEELKRYLKNLESVAVAFSSGVDSTFLLYAAKDALGDKAFAVTASSPSFPERERKEALEYCRNNNIKQFVFDSDELKLQQYVSNPKDRCYHCKKALFTKIKEVAAQNGALQVVEGSNIDDNGDYRPGHIAIKELDIVSPLRACGFTKQDIRMLSKEYGLPTWDKHSYACLASRVPYGEVITKDKLAMIDKAEQYLIDNGFSQLRVRVHNDIARIELIPEEFGKFMQDDVRLKVYEEFKNIGFSYITLDVKGYRTGSMNEILSADELAKGLG